MNYYHMLQVMAARDGSNYAWKITKDHLAESDDESSVGVSGPGDAPDELLAALDVPGNRYIFRMYDDDGILYYTGYGTATADTLGDEDFCYGPLSDYGAASGCVDIRWQGHKEWDCG